MSFCQRNILVLFVFIFTTSSSAASMVVKYRRQMHEYALHANDCAAQLSQDLSPGRELVAFSKAPVETFRLTNAALQKTRTLNYELWPFGLVSFFRRGQFSVQSIEKILSRQPHSRTQLNVIVNTHDVVLSRREPGEVRKKSPDEVFDQVIQQFPTLKNMEKTWTKRDPQSEVYQIGIVLKSQYDLESVMEFVNLNSGIYISSRPFRDPANVALPLSVERAAEILGPESSHDDETDSEEFSSEDLADAERVERPWFKALTDGRVSSRVMSEIENWKRGQILRLRMIVMRLKTERSVSGPPDFAKWNDKDIRKSFQRMGLTVNHAVVREDVIEYYIDMRNRRQFQALARVADNHSSQPFIFVR